MNKIEKTPHNQCRRLHNTLYDIETLFMEPSHTLNYSRIITKRSGPLSKQRVHDLADIMPRCFAPPKFEFIFWKSILCAVRCTSFADN